MAKIMIIVEDSFLGEFLAEMVLQLGHRPSLLDDDFDDLAALKEFGECNLLLIDYSMQPILNRLFLFDSVPSVVLLEFPDAGLIESLLACGVHAVLCKPVLFDEVRRAIETAPMVRRDHSAAEGEAFQLECP